MTSRPRPGWRARRDRRRFDPLDRRGGAAVQPSAGKENSLEHGWMRVERQSPHLRRAASRAGSGGSHRFLTRRSRRREVAGMRRCGLPAQGPGPSGQAGRRAWCRKPMLAKGGKGCRAYRRMCSKAQVIQHGKIHPEAGLHRRIEMVWTCFGLPVDQVEKPLGAFGKTGRGWPGHGETFHGFRFRHPRLRAVWPRAATNIEPRGEDRALIPRETVGIPDFAGDARRIALVSTRGFHAISRFSCGIDGSPRAIQRKFHAGRPKLPRVDEAGTGGPEMFIRMIGVFEVRDDAGHDWTPRGVKGAGVAGAAEPDARPPPSAPLAGSTAVVGPGAGAGFCSCGRR